MDVIEDRFIRLSDGTIYGYSELLAKRKDAMIVDGYTAAMWFKNQGIENEVTEKYPHAAASTLVTEPTRPANMMAQRHAARLRQQEELYEKRKARAEKIARMREVMKNSAAQGNVDVEDSSAGEDEGKIDLAGQG